MKSAGDHLKDEIERNESRSHWAGWVLVAGLVIEVALALVFHAGKSKIENWAPVIAVTLVALGVYGEIHFSGKAGRAQKALQSLTEGKLTEALDRAAKAEKELVDFRRPRRALMTPVNRARLLAKLAPFSGTEFDTGLGSGGEQMHFLWDLEEVLIAARWQQLPWGVHAVNVTTVFRNLRPLAGSVSAENVEIQLEPAWRQSRLAAAEALISGLKEIGIEAAEAPYNAPNTNVQAIHILIGPKG